TTIQCVFNDTATTEIYTLSLHDALPISHTHADTHTHTQSQTQTVYFSVGIRSEEHTSELQSHLNLVCRLLLYKRHTPCLLSDCARVLARCTGRVCAVCRS